MILMFKFKHETKPYNLNLNLSSSDQIKYIISKYV
jgi:hypothetical protein